MTVLDDRLDEVTAELRAERNRLVDEVERLNRALDALDGLRTDDAPDTAPAKDPVKQRAGRAGGRKPKPQRWTDDKIRELYANVDPNRPLAGQLTRQGVPRGSIDNIRKRAEALGLTATVRPAEPVAKPAPTSGGNGQRSGDRFGDPGPITKTRVDEQAARMGAVNGAYDDDQTLKSAALQRNAS